MNRAQENECFARFGETRDPRLLAQVFDATATELLQVAGHLSNGDRDCAQEVLQATFLTAMEQATSYDPSRDLRPWLLGILANHVRKERRRTLRQRGADVDEVGLTASDSPVAEAEKAELDEATLAIMQRLSQPLREPLVLHLRHGLTASEIGIALARQPATVRVQIQRGMQRLRELLPAGFAAAALSATLAPSTVLAAVRRELLATLPAVSSSSLALTGWRLYAMIAMAASVVLSVLFILAGGEDPAPPATSATSANTPAVAAEMVTLPNNRELASSPEATAPTLEVPPPSEAAQQNHVPVEFEVIYESDGKKAPNVPIGVRLGDDVRLWRTNKDGVVKMTLPYPGAHEVWVLGSYAKHLLMWPGVGRRPQKERHTIKIPAGLNVDVRVVDGSGNPVAGATIESTHGFRATDLFTVLGRTDAEGRYVHRDLATAGQLRATKAGFVPSAITIGDGPAGTKRRITLRLPKRGLRVQGVVRDEQGEPLANAELALVQLQDRAHPPQRITGQRNGSFELNTLHTGRHIVVGRHRGELERRGIVQIAHDGKATSEVTLRLTTGAKVIGKLTSRPRRAHQQVVLKATYLPDCVHGVPFLNARAAANANGAFELRGLVPGRYRLDGVDIAPRIVTVRENETIEWNPQPIVQAEASIRLLDHNGDALVGWRVSLIPEGSLTTTRSKMTVADGLLMHTDVAPWLLPEGTTCRFLIYRGKGTFSTRTLPTMITEPLPVGRQHDIRVPGYAMTKHEILATVTDIDGKPIPHTKVVLEAAYSAVGMTATEQPGQFRLQDQPPGTYRSYIRQPGNPTFRGPLVKVGDSPVCDIGPIVVPGRSRITVQLPADAATAGLTLQLANAKGETFRLRKGRSGRWQANPIYHDDYVIRGWSMTHRVVTKQVTLSATKQEFELALQPHAASEVVVILPDDYPRNAPSWSGTVSARQDGKLVFEHRVRHAFRGNWQDRLEFRVGLPPGKLELQVKCWERAGEATLIVPMAGDGKVTVRVQ